VRPADVVVDEDRTLGGVRNHGVRIVQRLAKAVMPVDEGEVHGGHPAQRLVQGVAEPPLHVADIGQAQSLGSRRAARNRYGDTSNVVSVPRTALAMYAAERPTLVPSSTAHAGWNAPARADRTAAFRGGMLARHACPIERPASWRSDPGNVPSSRGDPSPCFAARCVWFSGSVCGWARTSPMRRAVASGCRRSRFSGAAAARARAARPTLRRSATEAAGNVARPRSFK